MQLLILLRLQISADLYNFNVILLESGMVWNQVNGGSIMFIIMWSEL